MLHRVLEFLIEEVSTSEPSYLLHKALSFFRPVASIINDLYTFVFNDTTNRNVDKLLYVVGLFSLLGFTYRGIKHLRWLLHHAIGFVHFNPNAFRNLYGVNSYVVVTGFTEGIGLAFASEFAKLQFNLVLIGRNQTKIQNALKIIKRLN